MLAGLDLHLRLVGGILCLVLSTVGAAAFDLQDLAPTQNCHGAIIAAGAPCPPFQLLPKIVMASQSPPALHVPLFQLRRLPFVTERYCPQEFSVPQIPPIMGRHLLSLIRYLSPYSAA